MPETPPPATTARTTMRIELAPRSMALVLATAGLVWIAWQLWVVALVLVVALILAGTFNPLVESMERRRMSRMRALILLFGALVTVAGGLLFLIVPPLIDQLTEMIQHAPATRARLIAFLSARRVTLPLAHVVQSAGVAQTIAAAEAYLMGYASQALRVLGYGATSLMLAFYLLADGKRAQGVIYALVPRDYHMRLARILQNLETIVGGYMRGQLITCAACGAFTWLVLVLCGVPNAIALALFAAVLDVLPFIGAVIAIIPAVMSALPLGLPTAGVVLLALTVYTEFESRILVPRVYGQFLRLSSTTVILALLAGGLLLGVLGALLALPIAAGLVMILKELRVDMPGDDSVDVRRDARDVRTEARYEQMSAGATASDAGEIAKGIAADTRAADRAADRASDERHAVDSER